MRFVKNSQISAELIASPKPLPEDWLPRTWDYVHDLYPWPELGTMVGYGLFTQNDLGHGFHLNGHFGFYGGYLGGDLLLRWNWLQMSFASWGIETTSAYHVLEERLWQGNVAVVF